MNKHLLKISFALIGTLTLASCGTESSTPVSTGGDSTPGASETGGSDSGSVSIRNTDEEEPAVWQEDISFRNFLPILGKVYYNSSQTNNANFTANLDHFYLDGSTYATEDGVDYTAIGYDLDIDDLVLSGSMDGMKSTTLSELKGAASLDGGTLSYKTTSEVEAYVSEVNGLALSDAYLYLSNGDIYADVSDSIMKTAIEILALMSGSSAPSELTGGKYRLSTNLITQEMLPLIPSEDNLSGETKPIDEDGSSLVTYIEEFYKANRTMLDPLIRNYFDFELWSDGSYHVQLDVPEGAFDIIGDNLAGLGSSSSLTFLSDFKDLYIEVVFKDYLPAELTFTFLTDEFTYGSVDLEGLYPTKTKIDIDLEMTFDYDDVEITIPSDLDTYVDLSGTVTPPTEPINL